MINRSTCPDYPAVHAHSGAAFRAFVRSAGPPRCRRVPRSFLFLFRLPFLFLYLPSRSRSARTRAAAHARGRVRSPFVRPFPSDYRSDSIPSYSITYLPTYPVTQIQFTFCPVDHVHSTARSQFAQPSTQPPSSTHTRVAARRAPCPGAARARSSSVRSRSMRPRSFLAAVPAVLGVRSSSSYVRSRSLVVRSSLLIVRPVDRSRSRAFHGPPSTLIRAFVPDPVDEVPSSFRLVRLPS